MPGNILCVVEQRKGQVNPGSYEILKAARTLADAMGRKVVAILIGHQVKEEAKDLGERGADTVIVADHASAEHFVDGLYITGLEKPLPNFCFSKYHIY